MGPRQACSPQSGLDALAVMGGPRSDLPWMKAKIGVRVGRSFDGVVILVNHQPTVGHFGVPGNFGGNAE
jgi:hypothetical protein